MSTDEQLPGPIDYLVVEWPEGAKPTGEGLAILGELHDRGLIRVIDLAIVKKEEDGSVKGVAIADIDHDGDLDLVQFQGASSGMLEQDDFDEAGAALEPGRAGAILIYENTWAAPFANALRQSGAELVSSGRIPLEHVIEALDKTEST